MVKQGFGIVSGDGMDIVVKGGKKWKKKGKTKEEECVQSE